MWHEGGKEKTSPAEAQVGALATLSHVVVAETVHDGRTGCYAFDASEQAGQRCTAAELPRKRTQGPFPVAAAVPRGRVVAQGLAVHRHEIERGCVGGGVGGVGAFSLHSIQFSPDVVADENIVKFVMSCGFTAFSKFVTHL